MDKSVKAVYKDILNDKLPEENIPKFLNYTVNEYSIFAEVRLAMHYYAFYETYLDEGELWGEAAMDIVKKLNQLISKNIVKAQNGAEHEEAVRTVDRLRNDIMKRMKLLTAYTDIFQIYEYILNRVEYRFKVSDVSEDDEFAREILNFIFDSKDNVIINDKIREIIGQLPVRLTKQKYFDMIKHSIHEYKGASRDSLNTYLYMLRASAMLWPEGEMPDLYPKLWEQKEFLDHIDYTNISEAGYEEAEKIIMQAAQALEAETSVYYSVQEIVNEVYAMLICSPYIGIASSEDTKKEEAALEIIKGINEIFIKNKKAEPAAELIGHFVLIEGVQEELSYDLTAMEEALYQVDKNHRSLAESILADRLLNILLLCRDLLSNSLFIDFYEIKSAAVVSGETAVEEADKLIAELTKLFNDHDRMVTRAVMANTLNKMPVFFRDHKEVMDYVRYSLEKCTDLAEKKACMDIIGEIMSA